MKTDPRNNSAQNGACVVTVRSVAVSVIYKSVLAPHCAGYDCVRVQKVKSICIYVEATDASAVDI